MMSHHLNLATPTNESLTRYLGSSSRLATPTMSHFAPDDLKSRSGRHAGSHKRQNHNYYCSLLLNTAVGRRLVTITSGEDECQCLAVADQSRVGNLAACSRCPCKATIAHALHGKNELDLCMPTLWSLPTFKTWLRLRIIASGLLSALNIDRNKK